MDHQKNGEKRARSELPEEKDLLQRYHATRRGDFYLEVLRTDLRKKLLEVLDEKYGRHVSEEELPPEDSPKDSLS